MGVIPQRDTLALLGQRSETSRVQPGRNHIGRCAVAGRHFWPGDYVLKFGGRVIDRDQIDDPDWVLTIGANRYLGPADKGDLGDEANHSCDPNTQVSVGDPDSGLVTLTAIKMIVPGDEITYDYGHTLEPDDTWAMQCRCGSPLCRGVIRV